MPKILYMNQGAGNFGAIRYSDYDLVLLAENETEIGISNPGDGPHHFYMYRVGGRPPMSIHTKSHREWIIRTYPWRQSTRPIPCFFYHGVLIVFFHLKSGERCKNIASRELRGALGSFRVRFNYLFGYPILAIGDANRADRNIFNVYNFKQLYSGGGHSDSDLDVAYVANETDEIRFTACTPTVNHTDNGHIAIAVEW